MDRIYIAGPMRGLDEDNFPAFDKARTHLRGFGWEVVSPADLDRAFGYDPTIGDKSAPFTWGEALQRDIAAIERCHAIALLPGWESSKGVAVELAVAIGLGHTVYEFDENKWGSPYDHMHWLSPIVAMDMMNSERRRAEDEFSWLEDNPGIIACGEADVMPDFDQFASALRPVTFDGPDEIDRFEDEGGMIHVDLHQTIVEDSLGETKDTGQIRHFATGAVRGTQQGKLDFEGYFTPRFFEGYGDYMERNSHLPDGTVRDSDNWQKGFPIESFVKSGFRHMVAWWKGHRNGKPDLDACYGVVFNAIGYIDQTLKEQGESNG